MKIGILEAGHPPDSLRKNFGSYGEMFIALLDGYNFSFQLRKFNFYTVCYVI